MLKKSVEAERLNFDWGTIEWVASQSLGNSGAMTLGHVIIRSGCNNPVHRHPNCEEILYLLSGKLEHMLDGETYPMSAGDTITITSGKWHNAKSVGEEDAKMIVSFSSADRQTELRNT